MVDRQTRRAAALQLRRLASGRITNDEFEEQYPADHSDPAVKALWWFGWSLYSDLDTYRLIGRDQLSPQLRRDVARTVLFLHSEYAYEWSPWPGWQLWPDLRQCLTLGLWRSGNRRRSDTWRRAIDWDVWPFRSADDLAVASQRFPFASAA